MMCHSPGEEGKKNLDHTVYGLSSLIPTLSIAFDPLPRDPWGRTNNKHALSQSICVSRWLNSVQGFGGDSITLQNPFEPVHEILVLITYAQMPTLLFQKIVIEIHSECQTG